MKISLIQENNSILTEFFQLKSQIPESQHSVLDQLTSNFKFLESKWLTLIQSLESNQIILKDRHTRTESSLTKYKKIELRQNLKLKKCQSKEQQIKTVQEKVANRLQTLPKIWNRNLQRLKKKSVTWRYTPFASPSYDQEFDFLSTRRVEKIPESFQEDYSAEFEKVMQELSANKMSESNDRSGWKSELESRSESQDLSEIKKAISVLCKANLLRPEKQPILQKLSKIIKETEGNEKLVLYLQLLSINHSFIPSFTGEGSENDVKIEELLEATSFLSSVGPKKLESSILDLSEESYLNERKRGSIGKCSTKEMT